MKFSELDSEKVEINIPSRVCDDRLFLLTTSIKILTNDLTDF